MDQSAENEKLRIDDEEWDRDNGRVEDTQSTGTTSIVAITYVQTAYPTSAQRYYAMKPLRILGLQIEGNAATTTTRSKHLFAANLGTAIPPIGSNHIITYTGNRWVFRHDG